MCQGLSDLTANSSMVVDFKLKRAIQIIATNTNVSDITVKSKLPVANQGSGQPGCLNRCPGVSFRMTSCLTCGMIGKLLVLRIPPQ